MTPTIRRLGASIVAWTTARLSPEALAAILSAVVIVLAAVLAITAIRQS